MNSALPKKSAMREVFSALTIRTFRVKNSPGYHQDETVRCSLFPSLCPDGALFFRFCLCSNKADLPGPRCATE
jgi:hypothetical protein